MTTQKYISDRSFDALTTSLEQLTDQELEAEFAEDGEDLVAVAAATRELMLRAVEEHQRAHLEALMRERASQLEALPRCGARLPGTPAARRTLLAESLKRLANQGSVATAQFRELKDMTDEEVESVLVQLADLGLLEESESAG